MPLHMYFQERVITNIYKEQLKLNKRFLSYIQVKQTISD